MTISTHKIEGLSVRTGDIICTSCGGEPIKPGDFWRLLGRLMPGVVDHVAVYVGPGGRCVESGPSGVVAFEMAGDCWDAGKMTKLRGRLVDTFYGVAYPLLDRDLSRETEVGIRLEVARYCLAQAEAKKPYNLNFLDPDREDAFYCSQLAYKAYLPHGINLNTGLGLPNLVRTGGIIFPQEIWSGCRHQRAAARAA